MCRGNDVAGTPRDRGAADRRRRAYQIDLESISSTPSQLPALSRQIYAGIGTLVEMKCCSLVDALKSRSTGSRIGTNEEKS